MSGSNLKSGLKCYFETAGGHLVLVHDFLTGPKEGQSPVDFVRTAFGELIHAGAAYEPDEIAQFTFENDNTPHPIRAATPSLG